MEKILTNKLKRKPAPRVQISNIDMPFFAMVRFMVKWAIATIPAIFILFLFGIAAGMLFSSFVKSFIG